MTSDIIYYVWLAPVGVYADPVRPRQDADGNWQGSVLTTLPLNLDAFRILFGTVPAPGRLYRVTARWECAVQEEADLPVCVGGA